MRQPPCPRLCRGDRCQLRRRGSGGIYRLLAGAPEVVRLPASMDAQVHSRPQDPPLPSQTEPMRCRALPAGEFLPPAEARAQANAGPADDRRGQSGWPNSKCRTRSRSRSRIMIDSGRRLQAKSTDLPILIEQKEHSMTDPQDPCARSWERSSQAQRESPRAKQDHRVHDPELSQHVGGSLLERIRRTCSKRPAAASIDCETHQGSTTPRPTPRCASCKKAARQERIQKLIAQADLNPDWVFERRWTPPIPHSSTPIETARATYQRLPGTGRRGGGGCMSISTATTAPANRPGRRR